MCPQPTLKAKLKLIGSSIHNSLDFSFSLPSLQSKILHTWILLEMKIQAGAHRLDKTFPKWLFYLRVKGKAMNTG
jgi:hypothetical protein